jgi:hypothetical protein
MPSGPRESNGIYKTINRFLIEKKDEWFTVQELHKTTGLSASDTGPFLHRNFRRGNLERRGDPQKRHPSGRGALGYEYKVVRLPPLYKSKGEVAEILWEVLCQAQAPLRQCDMLMHIHHRGLQWKKITYDNVHSLVYAWLVSGVLMRNRRGHYKIKGDIVDRPPATSLGSSLEKSSQ